MKTFRKTLCIFMGVLAFAMLLMSKTAVYADSAKSDNGNGTWTPTQTETTELNGMTHQSVYGTSNNDAKQHINVLSMKTDGYSSKLVSWAIQNGSSGYKRSTLTALAEDYEKTHPGWIVLGGINADQYTTAWGNSLGGGQSYMYPQTYYPLIMDNESRFPINPNGSSGLIAGFTNDGSADSLANVTTLAGIVVHVYDQNGDEIAKHSVNKINNAPGANETSVWSTYYSRNESNKYISIPVESTNDLYIVETPELAYMSNYRDYPNGVDSFFGRGVISTTKQSTTLNQNQFCIETTNETLKSQLAVGTKVMVEYEYTDEAMNNAEAGTGYHSVHRLDGVDQPLVHTSYDGQRYSRAIFGRAADGSYILMTADNATNPNDLSTKYNGLNFDECNAALKYYGAVEAYQMDGGGSVTSILRNADGTFDVTNYPFYVDQRENLTGLLFVVRDSMVSVDEEATSYHSICLKQTDLLSIRESSVANAKAIYNETEYPFVNGQVVIPNLNENETYDIKITYQAVSKADPSKQVALEDSIKATTKTFNGPDPNFQIKNLGKSGFVIERDEISNIRNIVVTVGDNIFNMGENTSQVVANLIDSTQYDVVYTFDVYDEVTGNTYKRTVQGGTITTLSYNPPVIDSFSIYREYTTRVILQYAYKDTDSKVTKAIIKINDDEVELSSLSGTSTINDVDLANNFYEITLIITYADDEGEHILKSDVLQCGKVPPQVFQIQYVLDGGTNPANAPTTYTEGTACALPTPTKAGHSFVGWYSGDTKVESITETTTGDLILTARWSTAPASHTITYNLDGGTNGANAPTTYIEGTTVTLPTPTKEGYTFLGWYSGETKVERITENDKVDFTLTAKWQKNETPDTPTEPETTKKGCKKSMEYLMSFTTLLGLACFLFRKKK